MKKTLYFITLLFITAILINAAPGTKTATLALVNGKIVTMDKTKPTAEAIAVCNDRILALGSRADIKKYITPATKVIDLKGAFTIPGLIESHGHFNGLGKSRIRLDLKKAQNWDGIVKMVAEAAKKAQPGEWIQGRGWHQEKWDRTPQPNVDGLPINDKLNKVSPKNPVFLSHASGHSAIANAVAMKIAGIGKDTPDPEGGEIVRDKKGNPIGVFRENAEEPFGDAIKKVREQMTPKHRLAYDTKIINLAVQACLEKGVTTFHDAGSYFETIDVFKKLVRENKIGIRLYVMISEENDILEKDIAKYRFIGLGNHHLTVRTVKLLMDGALGSHGAWLLKPYKSLPSSIGLNTETVPYMQEATAIAAKHGFQVCTHAIGDRANRTILDIYEETFKKNPTIAKKDWRWRVEHAQHLHPQDLPRFAKLGVIAAMQGIHCTSDAPWVFKRLGKERAEEGAYMWRKLLDSGALISNGTDVPVENIDPMACFYASVTRKLKDGTTFFPEQRMTRMEALRSYTVNGAYAAFEEDLKGSLTPGKLADITVLSRDILTVPEEQIPSTRVLYTIVGGKVLYKSAHK